MMLKRLYFQNAVNVIGYLNEISENIQSFKQVVVLSVTADP